MQCRLGCGLVEGLDVGDDGVHVGFDVVEVGELVVDVGLELLETLVGVVELAYVA